MRILHVVPTYFPAVRYGGPIYSVHGLCDALAGAGHEVHVFTTSVDGDRDLDVPLGTPVLVDRVQVHYFPSKHLRRLYWSPSMSRALQASVPGFDIVHLHSIFLMPTSAAARIASWSGVPYLVAPRGMLVKDLVRMKGRLHKSAWLALVERKTLRDAAALHVTSEAELQAIAEFGYRIPPIEIVPNGVHLPELSPRQPSQRQTILFLGRISWKKGLDRLIAAMSWLPGVQLEIAGNDEEGLRPELERLASHQGVSDRIHFRGSLSGLAKEKALQSADLLVLPSYNENFGNVVLEALACARPVALTREVGLAQDVESAGVGRIVSGEPQAMARDLAALLAEPDALDRMGAQGRRWVQANYAWPAVAQQMEAVYHRLCRKTDR